MAKLPIALLARALIGLGAIGLLMSCGGAGSGGAAVGAGGGAGPSAPGGPGPVNPPSFTPTTTPVTVTELASGLGNPWGLAFLPDGRMLVTGRLGQLWRLSADGATRQSIAGLPAVTATGGQGGLLDVAIDPNHAANQRVYFTFSQADGGNASLNGTAVARAELAAASNSLVGLTVIYRQLPKVASSAHFGSRLVFDNSGQLFVTLGDRQNADQAPFAQDLSRGNGKVARITTDGAPAPGNPFSGGAQASFWSYGHRNPQGAALHPDTGELWVSEHGPQGGDEINRVRAGLNYGWPVISHGQVYGSSTQWGEGTAKAGMEQPLSVWETIDGSPWVSGPKSSTAPAGMAFFTGNGPAHWQGSLFVGALAGQALWRLQFDRDGGLIGRERLLSGLGERIRDVQQGPDGRLYLLTDSGRLLRVNA